MRLCHNWRRGGEATATGICSFAGLVSASAGVVGKITVSVAAANTTGTSRSARITAAAKVDASTSVAAMTCVAATTGDAACDEDDVVADIGVGVAEIVGDAAARIDAFRGGVASVPAIVAREDDGGTATEATSATTASDAIVTGKAMADACSGIAADGASDPKTCATSNVGYVVGDGSDVVNVAGAIAAVVGSSTSSAAAIVDVAG